ncbi:TIGR01459 family HAD-type hydrolase [Zavarzinia compransoris]|uniref:TIGR01459 family HAD-type hydrolase n=1 Tax=Zavarzinia compransoris TaxID=1264899 RepID=A0A317EBC5_9PROT|nr:TIGR01459 family HAD-type hydrolase [Zavarzinia compransoris]PWR23564.1 TIGR01459 family HAD-type hydrolase [Zavarzinia compransoris]TDP47776.1 HAD superfamily hydrolase (TIGR01459 family) [Zavarzinia compransoris]
MTSLLLSNAAPLLAPARGAIVDLWGVVHNGVAAFPDSLEALARFRRGRTARVVLVSNAPRPQHVVHEQLDRLGVPRDLYDAVVTSGDATREALKGRPGARVRHIGPARDLSLFEGLDLTLVPGVAEADLVVCTGLADDETETAEDYRAELQAAKDRGLLLVCANPDRIVVRGTRTIPCSGALAWLYHDLGGAVEWHGKPHASVYARALALLDTAPAETIAIGDGIETDIPGANAQGIPALLVTGGVHAPLWGDPPDEARLRAALADHGLTVAGAIDRLRW